MANESNPKPKFFVGLILIYHISGGALWRGYDRVKTGLLPFSKALRKSKLSEPPTRRRSFYNNAFTTTKNKYYFIKLVNRTIK